MLIFNTSPNLNLSKCEFAKAAITHLEKEVGQGQVRPIAAKIRAVAQYPAPTTILGLAGYYRAFCLNFVTIVAPLTDLVSLSRELVWDSRCE